MNIEFGSAQARPVQSLCRNGPRCPENKRSGLCSWREYFPGSRLPSWSRGKEIQMKESVSLAVSGSECISGWNGQT